MFLSPDPWTQQSKSAPTLKFRLTRILPQLWLLGDNWSGRGGFFLRFLREIAAEALPAVVPG
jgi:hypothetical protein